MNKNSYYVMDGSSLTEEQRKEAVRLRIRNYTQLCKDIEKDGYTPSELALELKSKTKFDGVDEMWCSKETLWGKIALRTIWPLQRFIRDDVFNKKTYLHFWQRLTRGWDDSDTYSLDWTIAEFTLPRLKKLRWFLEHHDMGGHPCDLTHEEWLKIVDEIIWMFEFHLYTDNTSCSKKDWDRYEVGKEYFGKWFGHFWW